MHAGDEGNGGRRPPRVRRMVTVALALALILGWSSAGDAQKRRIAMGCSQTTSSHYAYCVGQAKAINTLAPSLDVTVVETGGTVDNLRRMVKSQVDYGLVATGPVYLAWKGLEYFEASPIADARNLWYYTLSAQYFAVRADSGVKTPADLTGKKFNPGLRGSATVKETETILSILGIKPEIARGGTSDMVQAIQDNHIVGYAKTATGFQLDASTMDISVQTPIRVLAFSEEQVKRVKAQAPHIAWVKVPAGAITGMGSFWTPGVVVGFATLKSMPNDVAYQIVKAVMEGQQYQRVAFKGMVDDMITLTLEQALSPLHAGAIRYYREKGAKIPDNLIPPEEK